MKQFFFGLLACVAAALPAHSADVVDPETLGLGMTSQEAGGPPQSHDPSLCRDGMEMEPWTDDLLPMPVSSNAGCSVPEKPLAT